METIYQLPTWAETILVICVALMMAGLAVFLMCKAISEALDADARLQRNRRTADAKALTKWQRLYEDERAARIHDNAELVSQLSDIQDELQRARTLLAKVKVADL